MANKRMFSIEITNSDAFLDMGQGAQCLYFHLGMRCDDDGFLGNPMRIMRSVGVNPDDIKVLISKGFIIPFESGVVVIKHHRMNNNWDKHNCKRTVYRDELGKLFIKENKAYTLDSTKGLPIQTVLRLETDGSQSLEENRIEENRIDKNKTNTKTSEASLAGKEAKFNPLGAEIIKAFEIVDPKNKNYYGNTSQRSACDFLLKEYGLDEVLKRITVLPKTNKTNFFPNITTPVQLRDKWVPLQDAVDRRRTESKIKNPIAFV